MRIRTQRRINRRWGRSSCGLSRTSRSRGGFAVKELVVVLAVAGGSGACVTLLDPISQEQRDVRAPESEPLLRCSVPIAGEFVCMVSVDCHANPNSSASAYFVSRLQFAPRCGETCGGFLLDVVTPESRHRKALCQCRIWSFTSAEAAVAAERKKRGGIDPDRPRRATGEILAGMLSAPYCLQRVCRLSDPLWECVPASAQQQGLLHVTRQTDLGQLHDFSGAFPLARLGSAIRRAVREESWCRDDPQLLLRDSPLRELSPEQQQILAQALIWRLAGDLPAHDASSSPGHD